MEVNSLYVPTEIDGEEINHEKDFLFLPIVSRIAFSLKNAVFIWDAQAAIFLLKSGPMTTPGFTHDYDKDYIRAKSFSSSGLFFACMTTDNCVRVYKEFLPGYILHQQFTVYGIPAIGRPCKLHVSPNGESIIAHGSTKVHLWHTRDNIPSISNDSTQVNPGHDILLEFSPNGVLVAFVQEGGDTLTVLNLQSSDPPLTINVGMKVERLVVRESVILTAGSEGVATWNIIEENCGWKIVKDSKLGLVELESPKNIACEPWQSSLGYEVMHDGWVLSPTKERLLWLPHQWRSAGGYGSLAKHGKRWSGQFLGLGHCEIPEVVILKFLK